LTEQSAIRITKKNDLRYWPGRADRLLSLPIEVNISNKVELERFNAKRLRTAMNELFRETTIRRGVPEGSPGSRESGDVGPGVASISLLNFIAGIVLTVLVAIFFGSAVLRAITLL
jgi:hypothetical protein